jgi:membrane peptidoglycan carboxypeptidase
MGLDDDAGSDRPASPRSPDDSGPTAAGRDSSAERTSADPVATGGDPTDSASPDPGEPPSVALESVPAAGDPEPARPHRAARFRARLSAGGGRLRARGSAFFGRAAALAARAGRAARTRSAGAIGATRAGARSAIDATKTGTRTAIDATKTGTRTAIDATKAGTRSAIDATKAGTRGAIDATKAGARAAIGATKARTTAAIDATKSGTSAAIEATKSGTSAVVDAAAAAREAARRAAAAGTASVGETAARASEATKAMIDRRHQARAAREDEARAAGWTEATAAEDERARRALSEEAARAQRAALKEAADAERAAANAAAAEQRETDRQRGLDQKAEQAAEAKRAAARRYHVRLVVKDRARRRRRRRLMLAILVAPLVVATGLGIAAYYVDSIPSPSQLSLPESTTVYFADGVTPMARLGSVNRTILSYDEMNDAVKHAIVAAEDRTFWSNSGVDLASVLRAAWNNASGGQLQGASTITQQYVRIAAGLNGITYARKTREAILAWKMDHSYAKQKILEFYLDAVPFGRGAYGIEAAAQVFFGKTARRSAPAAQQVTVAEAMVLASLVKQPEPDPTDPDGHPGYDPARGGRAAANAVMRWEYVRDGMVTLGYLSGAEADALQYPHTVRALDSSVSPDGMDKPTGLVVDHVLSELRHEQPFANEPSDYIVNGGFRIVTTVDRRAQDAAEASADITRVTAPAVVHGQPRNWQAALVAVEPGTGRILAYYGGKSGTGADYAGWYTDANGKAVGYGEHQPGSSFKVYDLAEALRQGISFSSVWDSPAVKEFPKEGRTNDSPTGPVRNSSTAPCQPRCTLLQATVASLNVPFFELTERLGPGNVIDMADRAGIDSMWTDRAGAGPPLRVDLRAHAGQDLVAGSGPTGKLFTTEVGIGQYGITVLDHANGMATFAAGGERAQAHFVRAVYQHDALVYAEQLTQAAVGLTEDQVKQLTAALTQVPSAKLANGWTAAGKTGTWESGSVRGANSDTWMVGYTQALAAAVWLGTTDGKPLTTKDGSHDVFASTHAAPIWRQFMVDATAAMGFKPSDTAVPEVAGASPSPSPTGSPVSPAPSPVKSTPPVRKTH